MLQTLAARTWTESFVDSTRQEALNGLEAGQILHAPQLAFELTPEEKIFLDPELAHPHAKNIGYHAGEQKLWGVQRLSDEQHIKMKNMLDRFSYSAKQLINSLLPRYADHLILGRTSYRPRQVSNRKTSYRKDDKRLHVDAFPSAPNQGKRILRVFTNINPNGEDRVWRTGESFEQVATRFLPTVKKPFPGTSALLRFLKITKSYRTLYDHYMLQMHDNMKADLKYQETADQREVRFTPNSTWIVQTDHVSHAAMKGQYLLEQTFYLPVKAMENESLSPLRVLERMVGRTLA